MPSYYSSPKHKNLFHKYVIHFTDFCSQQECIPVGCVPAAHRPYAGVCFLGGFCSGGCLLWGVSALGGVCSQGVSALGGICSEGCLFPEGSAPGGEGGGGIPACTEPDPPL